MSTQQTALVTGGSAGIGAAISRALLDQGMKVIVLDRQKPTYSHANLMAYQVDLMDEAATRAVAGEIAKAHHVLHLVHNAGIIRPNPIEAARSQDLHDLAQLHWGAALILLQACLPAMRQHHYGRVVLISSRAALGAGTRTAYSATKAGLIGMGRTWALELAADGITVNMVAPGPIRATEMFHEIIPAGSERETALASAIPVKRLGEASDVANAVGFFLKPETGFVTGQTLYVCGGASVGTLTI
jgi:3-oxoacyl-[acyl-carrier protein] reductase